jgi:hypothetical protein
MPHRYHNNISKETGSALFESLVEALRSASAAAGSQGRVQHGTYGNVQRMREVSNDGPYSHVFDV